jgi:hypothetical protein
MSERQTQRQKQNQTQTQKENLDSFFSNLKDRSITVCHKCTENGVLRLRRHSDLGFCFYRPHEAIYARETGTLYLSWGSYTNDEIDMLTVVNAILDEAKACSLDASWKGTMNDRIIIENLDKSSFLTF